MTSRRERSIQVVANQVGMIRVILDLGRVSPVVVKVTGACGRERDIKRHVLVITSSGE